MAFLHDRITACLAVTALVLGTAPGLEARNRKGDRHLYEGRKAEDHKQWDRALEFYEKAMAEDPADPGYRLAVQRVRFQASQAHVDAGQKLRNAGNLEGALAEFQKAYAIDPSAAIAEQELRRTNQMIERAKQKPSPESAEVRSLTPAQQARKEMEDKLASLQTVPELRPLSRQITSLKMNNQPPRVLFETIGKLAGINVVFDPEYQPPQGRNFNLDLTNTTLEEALDHVSVLTKSFWKPLSANTIFIAADNTQKRRDYEDFVVKVFYLQNVTTVQELQEIATNIRSITDIRRVFTYNAQNAILLRGSVDQVAVAEKIIQDLDKPKAEVVIDVVVMEANRARTRDIAMTLISGDTFGIRVPITFNPHPVLSGTNGNDTNGGSTPPASNQITLAQLGKLSTNDFSLTLPSALLNLLMTDRMTRVLQSPQVRASDGMKASLKIGDRYPYATGSFQPGIGTVGVSPLVSTQFQFAEVGVNVDVQPKVQGTGEISMHVEIEISNIRDRIDVGGLSQPVIGQRKLIGDIRLKEGEVSLIGGLMLTQDTSTRAGIPGLGDVPVLRWLFANDNTEKNRGELMIALVPHIVRAPDHSEQNLKGIAAGTDQQLKVTYGPRQAATAEPPAAAPVKPGPAATPPAPEPPTPAPAAEPKPAAPAPSTSVKLSFGPAVLETKAGTTATVSLQLENATDLFSSPMRIRFDPKFLRLTAVKPGSLLSGDGQKIVFTENTMNDVGEASVVMNRAPGAGGISGSGSLVVLTFQVLGTGTTKVAVTDLMLRNSQLLPIPAVPPELPVTIR
jgi:general secretion pathway protein D